MIEEVSRLLATGSETIVQAWTQKVASDKRVQSDAQLDYLQLIDHVPQIIEELRQALARDARPDTGSLTKGKEHGRQRWRQGYELKEVIRELMLLRTTLMEYIETARDNMSAQTFEQLSRAYRQINCFMDEELYRTVEAYLEAPRDPRVANEVAA
ncbi:MAG: RsbRD N-terminal domain-containing protein [Pyrinomonadaceae bacterium]|nr:RsbRD N-terminal domain-containing protein [Pyrinomonadaceae bacterium]